MSDPNLNLTNQELLQAIKKLLTEDTPEVQTIEPIPFTTSVPLVNQTTLLKIGLVVVIVLLILYCTKLTISGTISGELVKNQS
jgi:hypothetical protein